MALDSFSFMFYGVKPLSPSIPWSKGDEVSSHFSQAIHSGGLGCILAVLRAQSRMMGPE